MNPKKAIRKHQKEAVKIFNVNCPKCNETNIRKYGSIINKKSGKRIPRYRCEDCDYTFNSEITYTSYKS